MPETKTARYNVTRNDLRQLVTPEATRSWTPLPIGPRCSFDTWIAPSASSGLSIKKLYFPAKKVLDFWPGSK